jgi:hypothetical protein
MLEFARTACRGNFSVKQAGYNGLTRLGGGFVNFEVLEANRLVSIQMPRMSQSTGTVDAENKVARDPRGSLRELP